ncbi:MAG: hypothetical protein FJ109_02415 [Deltaproteobacteria bacterium]|nr:hypothetical protein [Deltaproteobacteria bacterium]
MTRFASLAAYVIVLSACLALSPTARAEDAGIPASDDSTPAQAADSPLKALKDGLARVEKGPFSAALRARIQGWGGWVGEDANLENGDWMQEPGFRLRRARIGVDGTFFDDFKFELQLDVFDQERTGGPLYSAWVDWTPVHYIGATFGVQSFPAVRSMMMSSGYLPFLDRPMGAIAMAPENAMGLVLHSSPWKDHTNIMIGLFNGLRRGESFFDGYEGVGSSLGNRFDGLSGVARFDVEPLAPIGKEMADPCKCPKLRLGLGAGGFLNGTGAFSNDEGATSLFPFLDGGKMATRGASGYVHLKTYGFHFFGEYAHEWGGAKEQPTTPTKQFSDTESYSFNTSLGYVILKDRLGLAIRTELFDDNVDDTDLGAEMLVGGTVTWYVARDFLKAQLEYMYRYELGEEPALSNDYVIGGVQLMF